MTKDINSLTVEDVFRVLSALWKMNELTTIPAVAKDLNVNRVDFFYWVTETFKYNFRIEKDERSQKPVITGFYKDKINNPENPDWLPYMKEKFAKHIYFRKILDYGYLLGWTPASDPQAEWRNTKEKIEAIREAGFIKDTKFCFGGIGDGWNETFLGFREEDREKTVKALEEAGWIVELEKD